jgi:hypothetical protein
LENRPLLIPHNIVRLNVEPAKPPIAPEGVKAPEIISPIAGMI